MSPSDQEIETPKPVNASILERVLGYDGLNTMSDTPSPPRESVLVVGLGRFGSAVCATLVDLGVEVMAVDIDDSLVGKWIDILPHLRVADATDPVTLQQLGVSEFDAAVVAIGTGIEASVLTVAALSDAGAPNIWAKATTPEHGRILSRVGAHQVVYPEIQMGERVGRIVSGSVIDFFELDQNFVMIEIGTPAFLTGRSLAESGLRGSFNVSVVCLKPPGGQYTYAMATSVPTPGSFVVIAGARGAVRSFTDMLRRNRSK